MEKKFLKYTLIVIIFFVGLSMGVSYQESNSPSNVQQDANNFENVIEQPNNDFKPVDPYDSSNSYNTIPKIKHNAFTSIAKDGEYILKSGLELILDKSDDLFKLIFGLK